MRAIIRLHSESVHYCMTIHNKIGHAKILIWLNENPDAPYEEYIIKCIECNIIGYLKEAFEAFE